MRGAQFYKLFPSPACQQRQVNKQNWYMCGISGFNFEDKGLIEEMNESQKHRGPDGDGSFVGDGFSLGHRRLAIIDLSVQASQPMYNEDKSLVLVFNGEIYNFQEIKKELFEKGHKFISNSDSEVLIHGFEEYGEKLPEKLNGMFAFAIWNTKKKELFLCRDRVGIKPLYYYFNDGKIIFASEIKAILKHKIKREVSEEALAHYFRLRYSPQPLTMFKGVYKLPPASFLFFKDGKIEIKEYWNSFSDGQMIKSKKQARNKILELLGSSVKMRLISDKPVGVFLSGGIDSSAILYFASKYSSSAVKTFSVKFEIDDPEGKFNTDAALAKKTAEFFGAEHHEFSVSEKDILENCKKVAYHMDEPVSSISQATTMLLSNYVSSKVSVVLGGDGGDEVFGGYDRYRLSKIVSLYQAIPGLKHIANPIISLFGDKVKGKLEMPANEKRCLSFMVEKEKELRKVIKPEFLNLFSTEKFFKENYFNDGSVSGNDYENKFMLTDLQTWLVDESLMRTDKMTMAAGLEERVPFLDHRLVELGSQIPSRFKLSLFNTKVILKDALKPHLPEYLFNQPKRGWFTPLSKWLRTELRDFAYEILSESYCPETKKYFDFSAIKIILDDHMSKEKYNLQLIWSLISFQLWYKQFME